MESYKFEKFIKIRIGEPLTALDLNKSGLIFGSISGYIGHMNFQTYEVRYLNEIYDELVRGIVLLPENRAYCALGDLQGLIITFPPSNMESPPIIKVVPYNGREHNPEICSNTLAFIARNIIALVTANPTQNKDIDKRSEKNNMYIINYDTFEVSKLDPLGFSTFTVPFDFDGSRLIWLEYKDKGCKELTIYDILEKKNLYVKKYDKTTQFISHCKLFYSWLIYVEENKYVRLLNYITNDLKTIYHHEQNIMALDIFINEEGRSIQENDKIIIQMDDVMDKKQNSRHENNPLVDNEHIKLAYLTIISIDYNGNLMVYKNGLVLHNINVLSLSTFPENLKKQKMLFDMGYPYYIKSNGMSIAFTTDFGLCLINMGSKF